ncbi:MAG TPA: thymidine kinase [Acholeplasmataceae bacterium]|nr:thymidine kinase [Acholeplasmataceae bacterium]
MEFQTHEGWIEVISGCMFAGKTEELLRRIKRLEYANKKILVFKPAIDNRYSETEVVSHNNKRTKSYSISSVKEIYDDVELENPYAVAIDEAQFFNNDIIEVCETLADKGIRVIVAGLDTNFRGEPFGPMPIFLARAEYVTKLQAICQVCGAPATRTQRLIDGLPAKYNDPTIKIGASEQYEARCRHCHKVPK